MIPSEFGQKRKLRLSALTVSKSAKGDTGLSIDCVRCALKTGRGLCFRV